MLLCIDALVPITHKYVLCVQEILLTVDCGIKLAPKTQQLRLTGYIYVMSAGTVNSPVGAKS